MQAFTQLHALAALLDRANIDTDAIIPKQFLKKVERTGFGVHLFHEWRYIDNEGTQLNPQFVLNQTRYQGAQILVTRDNFGCGSSREHAPWALNEFGFRCIIAPSFADIFYNNCFKNGILPVVLKAEEVQSLFSEIEAKVGSKLAVDLASQTVKTDQGQTYSFKVDAFAKDCLYRGLDDIGWTLQFASDIHRFETERKASSVWMDVQI